MPKCSFFPLLKGVFFQTKSTTSKQGSPINEVLLKVFIQSFKIAIPVTAIVFKRHNRRQPCRKIGQHRSSSGCHLNRFTFFSKSKVVRVSSYCDLFCILTTRASLKSLVEIFLLT